MCGRNRARADIFQERENRNGERRTLGGVRARAELVEEAEGIAVRRIENLDHILHVPREGGERLLYALFVADVREHIAEHCEAATLEGRNVEPRLSHQGEESHRL